MTASNYDEALARVLAHEGGFTNHPSDPGGPTNFGITIGDYRRYVKPRATVADVRSMRIDEARAVYRAKYWHAQRCDELPAGIDYAVFDYGVNSGIGRSGKVLRRALKLSDNTSVVTDAVIQAAQVANASAIVRAICDERLRFLQSLKTWSVFGKGWGRRVAEVKMTALAMAAGARPAPSGMQAQGRGAIPNSKAAQKVSVGTIAAAGAAAAQQAHQSSASLTTIALILGAAVACATCGWFFWSWRRKRLQERPI